MDNYEFIRNHKVNNDEDNSQETRTDNSQEVTNTKETKTDKKKKDSKPLFGKKEKAPKPEKPEKVDKKKTPKMTNSPVFEFKTAPKNEFDFTVPDNSDFDYDWDGEKLIPLNPNVSVPVSVPSTPDVSEKPATTKAAKPEKEKKKSSSVFATPIFWILVAFGVAIIAGITVASTFLPKRVRPRDLVDVSFEGVEGHGSCVVKFNESRVKKYLPKYYNELIKSEYYSDYTNDWSVPFDELDINTDTSLYDILSSLYITVDPDYELSNNTQVEITFDFDNDYLSDMYKLRFVGESSTEIVTGLGNGTSINPFDDFRPIYSGTNGLGIAEVEYNGPTDYFDETSFDISPADGLSNGDTVTVSLYYDEEELLMNGYVVLQSEKTYTVTGLASFVDSYDSLDENYKTKLKADAQDCINAYAEENYKDLYELGELTYVGNAMGTIMVPDEVMDNNMLYMIYESELSKAKNKSEESSDKTKNKDNSSEDEDFEPVKVYYPVVFTNIIPSGNSFEYSNEPFISGTFTLPDGTASDGYDDAYNCYIEIVEVNASEYDMVAGDGFESFAELEVSEEDTDETETEEDNADSETSNDSKTKAKSSSSEKLAASSTDKNTSSSSSSSSSSTLSESENTTADSNDKSDNEEEKFEIKSIDDVSSDFLYELQDAALVTINEYIEKSYGDKITADEPYYIGEYFLRSKSDPNDITIYCVYMTSAQTDSEDSEPFDVYLPVKFSGVTGDGENFKYSKNDGIIGMCDVPGSAVLSTLGFIKESAMYKEVNKNSNYTLELSGSLTDDFSYEE